MLMSFDLIATEPNISLPLEKVSLTLLISSYFRPTLYANGGESYLINP